MLWLVDRTKQAILDQTVDFVKHHLADAEGGHDWWHTWRVWNLAKQIATTEEGDGFVIELGALLHDIADSKFFDGNEEIGPKTAGSFLRSLNIQDQIVIHVEEIISNVSFKGGNEPQKFSSPELKIVQDADRLDAMGAIGIARAFNYGGFKNRKIYNPEVKPNSNLTKEEYKINTAPTINHFYEKLLLLKDKMNTETGKAMAARRHDFMIKFLDQFYEEWQEK